VDLIFVYFFQKMANFSKILLQKAKTEGKIEYGVPLAGTLVLPKGITNQPICSYDPLDTYVRFSPGGINCICPELHQ